MNNRRLLAVGDQRGTVHRKKRTAVAWQRRWQGTVKAIARFDRGAVGEGPDDARRSVSILLVLSAEERRSWTVSSLLLVTMGYRCC
ncbi:hypothetical protein BHE74_00054690 [Ensete ventricosum]|nr:hypothetical protein GW17_00034068 [Ensete ventricosum]RWW39931.1 hypothetical protein BHE74_00054690 [Ensete ventricosum]RZR97295.1 hypothetical protein BHM03_00026450 [Ensete ventricosum]